MILPGTVYKIAGLIKVSHPCDALSLCVGPLFVNCFLIYEARSGFGGGVHGGFVFSSGAASASEGVQLVERARQKKKQNHREHHHQTHSEPRRLKKKQWSDTQIYERYAL